MPRKTKKSEKCKPHPYRVAGELPAERATSALWRGVPEKTAHFLAEMSDRGDEIERWFLADPGRISSLGEDPDKVLTQLADDLGLEAPDRAVIGSLDHELEFAIPNLQPFGSDFLSEVWRYAAESPAQTQEFKDDPVAVARKVGAQTGAPPGKIERVVRALRGTLGLSGTTAIVPGTHIAFDRLQAPPSRKFELRLKRRT